MKKYQVRLCLLGYQRYKNTINRLRNFNSKLFEITDCLEIQQMPPCDYNWIYTDDTICNLLAENKINNSSVDLCLCFTDQPIEANFFTRDLSDFDNKTVLCSFSQVEYIFAQKNVDLFNYVHGIVLNELVQIATLHKVDESFFLHDDTRNCLFDMCGCKEDITLKYSFPRLCTDCTSKIQKQAIDKNFIPLLENEFKTFKKPLFYRILDFVKQKPVLSILITLASSLIINLLSSFLFEMLK